MPGQNPTITHTNLNHGRFWTDHYEEILPESASRILVETKQAPLHTCYFDLEIRRTVESCGGWEEVKKTGGVSMLCIWDSMAERPYFYDDSSLSDAFEHLERAKVVVSFNGEWFDIPLLQNHLGRHARLVEHIDVFSLVRRELETSRKSWKGHGLDALCRNTLGTGKTGSGERAPHLAAEGKWAELVNYCLSDVLLTRDLCNFIRKEGYVIDKDGDRLPIALPPWFRT
jgi:DEAD/DEAH box helicase domain-containing protein